MKEKQMQLMKSKLLFGLVATVLVVGMTASTAAAQVSITLYPNGATEEVASSRTVATNDRGSVGSGLVISGTVLAQAATTLTNLILDYSSAITSSSAADSNPGAIPVGDAMRLEGATGVFAASTIVTVNFLTGKVTISMPTHVAASATTSDSGTMRLIGVRVDASATTGPVTVTPSLSNTANNYMLATSAAHTVVATLSAGLGTAEIGIAGTNVSSGTSTVFTNAVIGDASSSIVITEGFASAWRTNTQESNSGTALGGSGTQITLTFTGIPTGMTLTGVVTNVSSGFTAPTIGNAAVTSATDNVMTFTLSATSLTKIESFDVVITTTVAGTTTSFTAGSITAVADLAPIGAALSAVTASNNYPTETGGYPRFLSAPTAAITVVSIVASRTNLLVPYLVSDGTYDTGIVIANTTADPWTAANGGAVATAGAITYTFYPRTATGVGTSFSLTTSATAKPGVGLDAAGLLQAGGTHSVLLTELMTAASQTSTVFTGYVFIQTDFLLAHGISFVSDFTGPFTSFSPMMTLEQTEVTARTGFESLSF
jgi:hypothetical protein